MKIETNIVTKISGNSNMGNECWSGRTIFFFDKAFGIKEGDEVKCERDSQGFYRRVWVNDILQTEDNFASVHDIPVRSRESE